jgi:acyl-CoA thioester hydrolase
MADHPPQPATTADGRALAFDVPDPFLYPVAVQPDDLDAQGHVNNAVYVRWMDRAAFAHSCAVGYDWVAYQELGAAFVVRRHEIDYLAPAYAHDRVVVATWPGKMVRFTAERSHQIVRVADGQTLARAHTVWVYLDSQTGRPKRMPADMIAAFRPRG